MDFTIAISLYKNLSISLEPNSILHFTNDITI